MKPTHLAASLTLSCALAVCASAPGASLYVNDGNTLGDIYCAAPGAEGNTGLSPDSPKPTLSSVCAEFELGPGDTVYVDTGVYVEPAGVEIGEADHGAEGLWLAVQGSTNSAAGGAILDRAPAAQGAPVLRLNGTSYVLLRDLRLRGGSTGVVAIGALHCRLESIAAVQAQGAGISLDESRWFVLDRVSSIDNGGYGVSTEDSSFDLVHSLIAHNGSSGLRIRQVREAWPEGVRVENNSVAQNQGYQLVVSSLLQLPLRLRNNVFAAAADSSGCLLREGPAVVDSDYNDIYSPGPPLVVAEASHAWLESWQTARGEELHSLSHAPLFADPELGDFHLRSVGGRYVAGVGWVTDGVHSPCIDTGDPAADASAEPDGGGGRVNLGAYGASPQASASRPDPWLLAISVNGGGELPEQVPLRWTGGNLPPGATVRVEYSPDAGGSWTPIAGGLAAGAGELAWSTAAAIRTPQGLWRVVWESDSQVSDASDAPFVLRLDGITYYVNDADREGDAFCTAAGNDGAHGLTPDHPKASLAGVLAAYVPEVGDRILIDTGLYGIGATIGLTRVEVRGSPDRTAGGTRLRWAGASPGVVLDVGADCQLSDLAVEGGSTAIRASGGRQARIAQVEISGATTGLSIQGSVEADSLRVHGCGTGIAIAGSRLSGALVSHSLVYGNTAAAVSATAALRNVELDHVTLVQENGPVVSVQCPLKVSNSILFARGTGGICVSWQSGSYTGQYNDLFAIENAIVGKRSGFARETLQQWQAASGTDATSLSADPLFADPAGGDYHLASMHGRWQAEGIWAVDPVSSPCIDAADPARPYDREPEPNGGRANVGAFGNTPQASRSAPAQPPALQVTTLNDGGSQSGQVLLGWTRENLSPDEPVRVELSSDAGASWVAVATVAVGSGEYLCDLAARPPSARYLWRVVLESDPAVADACDTTFVVRNGAAFVFYVNDGAVEGDIFCTAAGSSGGDGATPATPSNSLAWVLERYDLEPGDEVRIDAGRYSVPQTIHIQEQDCGTENGFVTIRGAGTSGASPARFLGSGSGNPALWMAAARYVHLEGLQLTDVRLLVTDSMGSVLRSLLLQGSTGIEIRNDGAGIQPPVRVDGVVLRQGGGSHATGTGIAIRNAAVRIEHSIVTGQSIGILSDRGDIAVVSSTLAGNRGPQLSASGAVTLEHCIVMANAADSEVMHLDETTAYQGDHNDLYAVPEAKFGTIARQGAPAEVLTTLESWQAGTGQEGDSLSLEPRFADLAGGDVHLKSRTGRWVPLGEWVVDDLHSPCIDLGAAGPAVDLEPVPNGGRLNLGAYGGTAEASLSLTGPWLLALSQNSGGVLPETAVLRWTSGDLAPDDDRVRIEISLDAGASWVPVAVGAAPEGQVSWDTAGLARSTQGLWRAVLESNPEVQDTCDEYFAIVGEAPLLAFYVNDGSTDGDVFCAAPGSAGNTGLEPGSPLDSIHALFQTYAIGPGATVHIDTGRYVLPSTIALGESLSGTAAAPLVIRGSSNRGGGGTVLERGVRSEGQRVLVIDQLRHARVSDLVLRDAWEGVGVFWSEGCMLERVTVERCERGVYTIGSDCRMRGLVIRDCAGEGAVLGAGTQLENALVHGNLGYGVMTSGAALLRHCTIADNLRGALTTTGDPPDVRDCILAAAGLGTACVSGASYQGDYNLFHPGRGTEIGGGYVTLDSWQAATGQDPHSIQADPEFAAPAAGDYHLRSAAGRRAPDGSWVQDATTSVAIDLGDPALPVGDEPEPNGWRVNLGAYGGTAEASLGHAVPWLQPLSLNAGGTAVREQPLRWTGGLLSVDALVDVEFSLDDGRSWAPIDGALPAAAGAMTWLTGAVASTPAARWRVLLAGAPDVRGVNGGPFTIRNDAAAFSFYVNDGATSDDVYCSGPGDPAGSGLDPEHPASSVRDVLERFTLGPGDRVYIDTGVYPQADAILVTKADAGAGSAPVWLVGSAFAEGRGTVFQAPAEAPPTGLHLFDTRWIAVHDIVLHGFVVGAHVQGSDDCQLGGLLIEASRSHGMVLEDSEEIRLTRSTIRGNGGDGLRAVRCTGGETSNSVIHANAGYGFFSERLYGYTGFVFQNNTIAGNGAAEAYLGQTVVVQLRNSIFVASGSGDICLFLYPSINSGVRSNHNCFHLIEGAAVGHYRELCVTLPAWQAAVGTDAQSLDADPLFLDPGAGDFHLRSPAADGTYVGAGQWMSIPGPSSPCIDAGDPESPFGQEPDFNGFRVNVGAYGNTPEASRSLDTDGDGLSDLLEARNGCDPQRADTDGDGLDDGEEVLRQGTDPLRADTDGDGLSDFSELEETGTDPLVADTDGDGFSDGDEVVAGTDPLDAGSVFEIAGLTRSGGSLELAWPSAPGRRYRILRAAGRGGEFLPLYADIPATPPLNRQAVPVGAEAVVLFRVEVHR